MRHDGQNRRRDQNQQRVRSKAFLKNLDQRQMDQGDASYALYLIHLPLIQVLEKGFGSGATMILIAPPVLAVAAHLSYRHWEQPMMAILRPRPFDLRAYRLAG